MLVKIQTPGPCSQKSSSAEPAIKQTAVQPRPGDPGTTGVRPTPGERRWPPGATVHGAQSGTHLDASW